MRCLYDAMPMGDWNLLDPAFWTDDPHAALTWMRANDPLWRDEANDMWAVTRHADVHEVESRADVFVSGQGYRSFFAPGETNMIAQDDPRHAAQRGLVARRFTPKAVREHGDWIRTTVRALVEGMGDGSEPVDVVPALAAQLPGRLTARLLGWDEDRWADIAGWSERLMRYDRLPFDESAAMGMMTAIMEFNSELQPMVTEARGCPVHDLSEAPDLVSVWAHAELDGEPLDPETIMHETGLFISGGAETTRTVIARGLRAFCDHPDQWERLVAEPALIPTAVDELVRWVTPLNNFFRTATVDTTVGGRPVAAGDRFALCYPSANRDEDVFEDPFTFDITRTPNPHLGFGFGTHFCLGASLARFELGIVLEELTGSLTNLRVGEELVDEPNMFAHAVRSFGLSFDRR